MESLCTVATRTLDWFYNATFSSWFDEEAEFAP